jgi:hypothetical protein
LTFSSIDRHFDLDEPSHRASPSVVDPPNSTESIKKASIPSSPRSSETFEKYRANRGLTPSWPSTHDSRRCRLIDDHLRRRTFTTQQLEPRGPVVGPGLCYFGNLRRNRLGTGIKSDDNILSQVEIIIDNKLIVKSASVPYSLFSTRE